LRAEHPNQVWAVDFQFDETADRRRIKLCNVVDEHTREALSMRVARNCTADDVVTIIEGLVAKRGAPMYLRMDNGPELIAWALREWCRLHGTTTSYIEPGSPWENPFVESFNGRVRDELLNIEEFGTLTEATVVVEAWRIEYNTYRPTAPSAASPPPSTPSNGPSTNQHSHDSWTTQRGPLSPCSLTSSVL
jgi:transposase InsO family protein